MSFATQQTRKLNQRYSEGVEVVLSAVNFLQNLTN